MVEFLALIELLRANRLDRKIMTKPYESAAAKGFGVPALNNNGGSYDIGRAIIESCEEMQSPFIIQCYEPNLDPR